LADKVRQHFLIEQGIEGLLKNYMPLLLPSQRVFD
jgi:hypothetical protein